MCVITNLLSLLVKLPDQVCDSQKKFRSRATWTREVQQRNQQIGNVIIEILLLKTGPKFILFFVLFCFVLFFRVATLMLFYGYLILPSISHIYKGL